MFGQTGCDQTTSNWPSAIGIRRASPQTTSILSSSRRSATGSPSAVAAPCHISPDRM
jgi:hypothetical protein